MDEKQLRDRLNEIDKILDDESISDEQFNEFESEAREITKTLGKIESERLFANVRNLVYVSDWMHES